ncbi:MAG: 3-dehydroquinate synthase, partial [Planctomycetota bacterium]
EADPAGLAQRLAQLGLPTRVPKSVDRAALEAAMGFDKKGKAGRTRLVLLRGLGKPGVLDAATPEVIDAGWSAVGD